MPSLNMRPRLRSSLDLIVTLAMGAAALMLIWRLVFEPAPVGIAARGPQKEPVEDLQSKHLSMTLVESTTKGRSDAQVVLIEFADFECPFCARHFRETASELERDFVETGKVKYSFRHLPLKSHPFARPAAQAAQCAARQGKFWEMHRHLFTNRAELAKDVWLKVDDRSGINVSLLEKCMGEADDPVLKADASEASRLGVVSTPTFFVGRRRADGTVALISRINGARPYSDFRGALDQVLSLSQGD
jgi:protein-disulfide isomerase